MDESLPGEVLLVGVASCRLPRHGAIQGAERLARAGLLLLRLAGVDGVVVYQVGAGRTCQPRVIFIVILITQSQFTGTFRGKFPKYK